MWPYNHCEWKTITYGINKSKSYWRKNKTLILMCTVPTLTIVGFLALVLTK